MSAPKAGLAVKPSKLPVVTVRRMHRRDINRTWEFLKLVFRGVNQKTVEYQRPRSKVRFVEVYDDGEIDQLLFEVGADITGYAECSYSTSGADNWMNPRYFDKRGMRPLFVDELAVHPLFQGKGVGGFMLEQLQHLARARGCTHLVLEVAQNNKAALTWYHKRNFYRLDAAIFMAQKVPVEPELLPPRPLKMAKTPPVPKAGVGVKSVPTKAATAKSTTAKGAASAPPGARAAAARKKATKAKPPGASKARARLVRVALRVDDSDDRASPVDERLNSRL